jgi:hypothetical protein
MRATAEQNPPSGDISFPSAVRTSLFSDAGTMITNGHLIVQLLSRAGKWLSTPEIRSFCESHEEITLLRNKITHIHDNIGNFSRKKARVPPIQGILSYAFLNVRPVSARNAIEMQREFYIVTINVGASTHEKHTGRLSNPLGQNIELPVGCFTINTFDHYIYLSQLYADVVSMSTHFSNVVEEAILLSVEEHVNRDGGSKEGYMDPIASGITSVMTCNFSVPDLDSADRPSSGPECRA